MGACLAAVLRQLADDNGNLAGDAVHDLTLDEVAGNEDSLGLLKDETVLAELCHDGVIESTSDDVLLSTVGEALALGARWVVEESGVVLLLSSASLPLALGAAAGALEADDRATIGNGSDWR